MHQPFYKDLVAGEYRLPWVRMHALKDYYGMVKLLDEFPHVHQNFNLVPSLIVQLQEYVSGRARDPFLEVVSKPAAELSPEEKRFALRYLFQANLANLIGRYPRYLELYQAMASHSFSLERGERYFRTQDYADLQVLSQLAWFDEFFLDDPEIAALIRKQRDYTRQDQELMLAKQRHILSAVLPAYADAARRGSIELSTSPFYHPILPLLCDTDQGRVSTPGLPLPRERFQHPEDAVEQLRRGLDLHQQVFGIRPVGVWPSEGSVSEQVLQLAHGLGVRWMATDEGVLGRSINTYFERNREDVLLAHGAERLYNIYRYRHDDTEMHMVFRDHSLSDLIGFVYSGMPAAEAADHFLYRIRASAAPLLQQGRDAVVSVILDGENAWEYYPASGREFLRRLYDRLQQDPTFEPLTISEALSRHPQNAFAELPHVVPGSWINSNFNVWIGAPEDNRSWDYLSAARQAYEARKDEVSEEQRKLALEELFIAEGSDWNWWYGPEHHSANDPEFDELYRKHLSNIYVALGATPPGDLAQPLAGAATRARFVEQTAYIHPRINGETGGYFDWMGAARYLPDRSQSAMHGRTYFLKSAYAGIDHRFLYCRLDFTEEAMQQVNENVERLAGELGITLTVECFPDSGAPRKLRLDTQVRDGLLRSWQIYALDPNGKRDDSAPDLPRAEVQLAVARSFEIEMPLSFLQAVEGSVLHLRFSLWRNRIPVDALPREGSIPVRVLTEEEFSRVSNREWRA
jgi:alpha-amylase/alpha-mannosidase (GH57 family)